jgi:hypothetical protein
MSDMASSFSQFSHRGAMKLTIAWHWSLRHHPQWGALAPVAASCASLVFALLLVPQLDAQKVKIEYDKTTDFSKFKTFAWVQGTPLFDPELDVYVRNSITDMLRHIGMNEVPLNAADILVTYHAAVGTDISVGTALDPTFAATGGTPMPGHSIWETGGGAAPAHVTKGSLVFEILDRAANRPVWTGVAKHTVKDTQHERSDQIQKALDKLFRSFPPGPGK